MLEIYPIVHPALKKKKRSSIKRASVVSNKFGLILSIEFVSNFKAPEYDMKHISHTLISLYRVYIYICPKVFNLFLVEFFIKIGF